MALDVEAYLARVDLARLGLHPGAVQVTPAQVQARAAAVGALLAGAGISREALVEALAAALLPSGAMNPAPMLLDLTPELGLAAPVDAALRRQGLRPRWAAMAQEPAALRAAAGAAVEGRVRVVPFLGGLADVEGALRAARTLQPLPELLDGAMAAFLSARCAGGASAVVTGLARVLGFGAPLALAEEEAAARLVEELALERFHHVEARALGGGPTGIAVLSLRR